MANQQTILITGTSSGFGLLMAKKLVGAGHTVLATLRDKDGRNKHKATEVAALGDGAPGRIHVVELDVTSDASVDAAVRKGTELAGSIDVVVNNAGYGGGGYTEAFTSQQLTKMLDVNVVGPQRLARAVLPGMRERSKGLLIFISSTMGRITIPFAGAYTSSKYAVEGLAESYRYELARAGVDVAIIEPGGFATSFFSNMAPPDDTARHASYGELANVPDQMWAGFGQMLQSDQSPDPGLVAEAVATLVATAPGKRPLRTVVDPMMGGQGPKTINETSSQVQSALLEGLGVPDLGGVKS